MNDSNYLQSYRLCYVQMLPTVENLFQLVHQRSFYHIHNITVVYDGPVTYLNSVLMSHTCDQWPILFAPTDIKHLAFFLIYVSFHSRLSHLD